MLATNKGTHVKWGDILEIVNNDGGLTTISLLLASIANNESDDLSLLGVDDVVYRPQQPKLWLGAAAPT